MTWERILLKSTLGAGIFFGLLSVPLISSQTTGNYLGWKQCTTCHADIGDDSQNGRHARAIESLKKTGQENLPACVSCHVTGYEKEGGFIDCDLTPEMANVQCEECHGPGSEHVKNPMENAMIKSPGVDVCRRCHTEAQDPGFDYEKRVTGVHGPQP